MLQKAFHHIYANSVFSHLEAQLGLSQMFWLPFKQNFKRKEVESYF